VARGNYGAFVGVAGCSFAAAAALCGAAALNAAAAHRAATSAAVDVAVAAYFGFFAAVWGQLLCLHAYLAARRLTTADLLALQRHPGAPRPSHVDDLDADCRCAEAPRVCLKRIRGDADALPDLAAPKGGANGEP